MRTPLHNDAGRNVVVGEFIWRLENKKYAYCSDIVTALLFIDGW